LISTGKHWPSGEVDQLRRIVAVMVDDLDPAVQAADDLAVLGVGLPAMDAEADDNLDIAVVTRSRSVRRPVAAGKTRCRRAGDVRGDDDHLLAGCHDLRQSRVPSGAARAARTTAAGLRRRHRGGRQQGGVGSGEGIARSPYLSRCVGKFFLLKSSIDLKLSDKLETSAAPRSLCQRSLTVHRGSLNNKFFGIPRSF